MDLSKTPEKLLHTNTIGLYCPIADFYIDPLKPVKNALITHAHADHARAGHNNVLATRQTLDIMALRYGENFCQSPQAIEYGEILKFNDVEITFFPAGHVLGSAQILIEYQGFRIVCSGDYKPGKDPTCTPFEIVSCNIFISEATFALPVFRHPDPYKEIEKLLHSVKIFPDNCHIVGAYSLGKAQRIMALLRAQGYEETIYIHGAIEKLVNYYCEEKIDLGRFEKVKLREKQNLKGKIIIAPPSAMQDRWAQKLPDPILAFASGWMRIKARARQRGIECPLLISDHADWDDLIEIIPQTNAQELWVTHGQEEALIYWADQNNIKARPLSIIGYGEEQDLEE